MLSGLKAIQSTVDEDEDFNAQNIEIATLKAGEGFKYLNDEEKGAFLPRLKNVRILNKIDFLSLNQDN